MCIYYVCTTFQHLLNSDNYENILSILCNSIYEYLHHLNDDSLKIVNSVYIKH